MPSYILRLNSLPDKELWARFKARSAQEGIPMRALMLKLVELYADGELKIAATALCGIKGNPPDREVEDESLKWAAEGEAAHPRERW